MKRRSDPEAVAELIGDLSRALVDSPEQVTVHAVIGTSITIVEVSVRAGEVAKLIGRQGRTANALRALLRGIGGRTKRNYALEILEPGRGNPAGSTALDVPRPNAPHSFEHDPVGTARELLCRVARALVDHRDQIKVEAISGAQASIFELRTDLRDVSRVIGKRGRTADALRTLF